MTIRRSASPEIKPHLSGRVRSSAGNGVVDGNKTVVDAKQKTGPVEGQKIGGGAFVKAGDDVAVDLHVVSAGGDVAAGTTRAGALAIESKRNLDAGPAALGAEARLASLLGRAPPPASAKAPKPAVLEKAIVAQLGEAAQHMSALEVANALGAPSWAGDIHAHAFCDENAGKQPHWLLAVHLTKWMESIDYAGAPLGDVAQSFLAAHPDLAQRFSYVDGAYIAALQKAYPFMPQWSASPKKEAAAAAADDWDSVAPPADPFAEKLSRALTQLSEVPLSMKVTSALADRLAEKDPLPFAGANVVMVQHMLGQASPLIDAMTRAGMDVEKAEYVGIPYQKNPAVKTTLEQGHGVAVTVPEVGNIDDMWRVITEAVDRAWERHEKNGEPILILDDGGYASKYINQKYKEHAHVFKVVEQTTRGLTEISKLEDVQHSIVDVAGSYGKRFESAQVGDAVKMAVRRVLDAVTTTPARKDVLIVGAGKVGEGVADSFAGDGARVTVFDPYITPVRKRELEKKGFTVVTDKAQALDKKFLVVGCSGHRSIDMSDFAKMSSPVFLASASSKRVEIDTIGLGDLAKDKEGHLRRILAAKVGEQETWHYFLQDGRIVTAMADGLPVNFQQVNSIAPELIDHTMALMLLGGAQAMTATKPGLNELDPNMQFWLQAQMEGLTITPAGSEHAAPTSNGASPLITLTVGDAAFSGTRAEWMSIATSAATPPAVLHALFAHLVDTPKPGAGAMDPIVLAVLESKHELGKETIDLVLEYQCLPHVARLLKNEGVSDAQEDRLLEWLEKSFWCAAGMERDVDDVRKYRAVAVEGDEKRGYDYLYFNVIEQSGKLYLHPGVTTVRDAVVHQAGDILFGHPRCPQYLRDVFLQRTYQIAQDGLASTVLRVRSPAWKPEELEKLFPEALSAAWSRKSMSGKRENLEYCYDLIEAFRDHPSSPPEVVARADEFLDELATEAHKKGFTLQGEKGWTPTALGIALPDYA